MNRKLLEESGWMASPGDMPITTIGNSRGQYGAGFSYRQQQDETGASLDYATLGPAVGIGLVLGILIGSNITFHTPIRRRR